MRDTLDKWLNLHPSVQIVVLIMGVGAAGTGSIAAFSPFVSSAEYTQHVVGITARLDALDTRMWSLERGQCTSRNEAARAALAGKLRDLDSQVWTIERAVASGSYGAHDITLLDSLKSQQREAQTDRNDMGRRHCD